jgi:hypothetical protein
MQRYTRYWPLAVLSLTALWLRLANLGYSDYQGDEIAVLTQPAPGQNWLAFIFEQRRGPIQFLITQIFQLVYPSNSSEFLTRMPFALAGALSVLIFYALIKQHIGKRPALFAALFMAINGLFVGLTRIVQYQAYVLLFSITALYFFSLAIYSPRWKITGIYSGFAFWTLAVLTHYDSVFISPFVAFLLYRWYRGNSEQSVAARLRRIGMPAGAGLVILVSFYAFLLLSASPDSQAYWLGRLTGGGDTVGIPSSIVTFQLYNPLFVLPIYVGLGLFSIVEIKRTLPFIGWFLFAWIVMELLVNDPGTHIYTYLLPASVFLGIGLDRLVETLRKISPVHIFGTAGLILPVVVFGGLFGLSHLIFVDHTPEYPWEARGFLFWKIERPSSEYKLWVFGFPYRRHWEEIGEFATSAGDRKYLTNEKDSIAEYYLAPLSRSGDPDLYIQIMNPQSFIERLANEKIRYWTRHYPPDRTYQNGEQVVAEIYLLPPGTLDEIRAAGY